MSLLYKKEEDQTLMISIRILGNPTKYVDITFSQDAGKYGTIEIIDAYKLTPKRLLDILQDREDYTEDEL